MKIESYIQILLWGVLIHSCVSQQNNRLSGKQKEFGYRIEKKEVVFEFDIREYELVTDERWGLQIEFADIDIQKIAVSGEFNNWSKDGWKMYQVSEYVYQLRKKLKDFDAKINWEYKFVVNEKYWVEPPPQASNRTRVKPYSSRYQNLVLSTGQPSLEGNTIFTLKGYPNAQKVCLAGSFNNWQPQQILMVWDGEAWICQIDLPPGHHLYKFVVDNEWMEDPQNPYKQRNRYGSFNSILWRGVEDSVPEGYRKVVFSLAGTGYEQAKNVFVAGSFNDWKPNELACELKGDAWVYVLNLPLGKHEYKFIVDGIWMTDPYNPNKQTNDMGTKNSVLTVE